MRIADQIRENVLLSAYTTFQIGGCAEYFLEVDSPEMLREAIHFATEKELSLTILGGGSNVLISDVGVSGLVVKLSTKGIVHTADGENVYVTAAAGEPFDAFVQTLVDKDVWGLENLSGVPGSVGATPIQNVGAYGVEVSDHVSTVVAYDTQTDTFVIFDNERCGFRYRHSFFKRQENQHYIVLFVTFKLSKKPTPVLQYKDLKEHFGEETQPSIRSIREAILEIRAKKFPDWKVVGTAGSFFKNPIISEMHYRELLKTYPDMPGYTLKTGKVKVPLGWIIEWVLNMKGVRENNVGTFKGQSLVLVNHGNATASDVYQFARHIAQRVKETTDIDAEWEITKIE